MAEVGRNHSVVPRLFAALVALALLGSLVAAASAAAQPEGARVLKYTNVRSTSQAGAHPDVEIDFEVGTRDDPLLPGSCFCNQIKDALVEFPAGFIGNPHSVPECTVAQFSLQECPIDSQVGLAKPTVLLVGAGGSLTPNPAPLYNLVPQPGQAGLQGFKVEIIGIPTYIVIGARTGSDYGLNAESKGIPTNPLGLQRFVQDIWGVPASPVHDPERAKLNSVGIAEWGQHSNSPERPYLSNPTSCVGEIETNFTSTAYDLGVNHASYPWPETTGCEQLNFNPSQSANPTTEAADSASGLDVILKVPQNDSPNTPSDSEIKGTVVKFPEGFSINPAAADGKTTCSDVQAHFGRDDEAQCPEFSKVGTLSIDSWALPAPLPGAIYLGDPKPGDPYPLIYVADGFGTHIKFASSTRADPDTGRLTAVFENLPQSPLTEFTLHFFGSERGLLATPTKCGTYPVESEFEPWAAGLPKQTSIQFFSITSGPNGSPCPGDSRPFQPGFRASGASNGAGAHSPVSVYVTRRDGDQTLSTIGVNTPPGVTATLKGIPRCSDQILNEIEAPGYSGRAELASPRCPADSQVGTSSAGAGPGTRSFYAPGRVYLSGPYKGAPLSFTVVTPSVSGPYDLGNVVNRVAVYVDPTTAAVTAVSDPLPQVVRGIPLRLRSILINLDRRDFTLNPTNCNPFEITGLLTGDQGGTAAPQSHFQVANCDNLAFDPTLRAVLKGPVKRGGHPAFTATVSQDPSAAANLAKAIVTLPHSEFLDQGHIRTVCTRVQFAAGACPAGSVYGRAKAITPLLDDPLEGPVYLRSSSNVLPDLVADLRGPASMPIQVVLVGKVDSPNQQIRTTFSSIPDTPVSKFVLQMQGGKKGLLVNSTDICRSAQRVKAKITGQSGASANQRPALEAPCGKAGKTAKRIAAANRRAGR
jgi:hypothetical protein